MAFKKRNYRRPLGKKGKMAKKSGVTKAVKTFVKKAIAIKAENKVVNIQSSVSLVNYATDNTMRAIALTPNTTWGLGQGVTQGTRVGNSITIKRIMFNYTITFRDYNALTNPTPKPGIIQMVLCRTRNRPTDIPNNADVSLLYQNGASASAPLSTIEDCNRYYNKDYWEILKSWTHRLGAASITGTGGSAAGQYYANNDFNLFIQKKLNIAQYIPKTMKFQDGTTSQTGKGIFLLTQFLNADGSVLGNGQIGGDLKYYINFEFEDS